MLPISEPATLRPGHVLYHSAFGFAQVRAIASHGVELQWERTGTHLPEVVGFENLSRVYTLCPPNGFFDRAFRTPKHLGDTLQAQPADALVWLLDDLDRPLRLRDVMDWFVGRQLFTAKTFVRWWGDAEAMVRNDTRLTWNGSWVQRTLESDDGSPAEVPLPEDPVQATESDLIAASYDEAMEAETELAIPEPRALSHAHPPTHRFALLGRAMAQALVEVHSEGRLAHPSSANTVLLPDGRVLLEQGSDTRYPRGETPGEAADVYAAATVLIEAFVGRELPQASAPHELLPYLRHGLPGLSPSVLAPISEALHPARQCRPTAAAWLRHWQTVVSVECERPDQEDRKTSLTIGYDSHIGRVKLMQTQTNQDALFVSARGNRRIMVLCDGISVAEVGRGDIASRLAAQAVGRLWEHDGAERLTPQQLLKRALVLANKTICEHTLRLANGELHGKTPMGTTITVAAAEGNHVHLAWLGDSRAYLIGPAGAALLTADDNVSGERFVSWCRKEIPTWHASGHALVRYLGHFAADWKTPAPLPMHYVDFVLRPEERLLLCSDGITDYIGGSEPEVTSALANVARAGTPDQACRALVALANQHGGGDNATVIIADLTHTDGADTDW